MNSTAVTPASALRWLFGPPDLRPYLVVEREGGILRYGPAFGPQDTKSRDAYIRQMQRGLLPIEVVCLEQGDEAWEGRPVRDVNPDSAALRRESIAKAYGRELPVMRR